MADHAIASLMKLRWKRSKGASRAWNIRGELAYFELDSSWLTWYDRSDCDRTKLAELDMRTVKKVEHASGSGRITLMCGSFPTVTVYRLVACSEDGLKEGKKVDDHTSLRLLAFAESLRLATGRARDPRANEGSGFMREGLQLHGNAVLLGRTKQKALSRSSKLDISVCFAPQWNSAVGAPDIGMVRIAPRPLGSLPPAEDDWVDFRTGRKALVFKGPQPGVSLSALCNDGRTLQLCHSAHVASPQVLSCLSVVRRNLSVAADGTRGVA